MSLRRVLSVLVIITCYRNVSAVDIGGKCEKTSDCVPENVAICVSGVCKCNSGYVPNYNKCIRVANHDEKCEESVQCNYSDETVCREGTCQCTASFSYNGKRCVGNISIGSPCERDIECVVPYDLKQETVWCHNKICICKNGFKAEGNRCVIGGDCTDDAGCKDLGNSFCNTQKRDRYYCACVEGYLPVGNNTKCLPVVHELGTGCEYDEQCSKKLGQAVCIQNQCQCAEGASLTEDKTCSAAVSSVISLSCFLLMWLVKII